MAVIGPDLVEVLTTAMVTGAGDEAGRRGLGWVTAAFGRCWRRRSDDPGGEPPEPPRDPEEARRWAEAMVRDAGYDEVVAALLREIDRERKAPHLESYVALVDRRDEVARVRELASEAERPRLVVLLGPSGIGTSTLAVGLSEALSESLPHRHLYVDLAGAEPGLAKPSDSAASELLLDLGVQPECVPADLPGKQRMLTSSMENRSRRLVVLDNVASAEQVIPLLLSLPGLVTVVATSHRMPVLSQRYGARFLHLDPLAPPDAEELMVQVAGPEVFRAGGAGVREAIRRCGGVPATITQLASLAALDPGLDWRAEMLDPQADGVARAYRTLSPAAARLHRLLGRIMPVDLGRSAVAALAGDSSARAGDLLDELVAHRLLDRRDDRSSRQTAAAHRHAAAQHEPDAAEAVRAFVDWCLETAADRQTTVMPGRWYLGATARRLADRERRPRPERRDALRALRVERTALVAAVRVATEWELWDPAWQLCESIWALHLMLGFHEESLTAHTLGVQAARSCGDRRAEARMLVQRGFSYLGLRRFAEARADFEAAYDVEPEDHPRGRATALESIGLLLLAQEEHVAAEDLFRRALPFAREAGDPRALALLAHHIGRALAGQRRLDAARDALAGALRDMRALPVPDEYNVGRVLTSLGETRLAAGDLDGAAEVLDQALTSMTADGASLQQARVAELRASCEPSPERRRALWTMAWEVHVASGDAERADRLRRLITGERPTDPATGRA